MGEAIVEYLRWFNAIGGIIGWVWLVGRSAIRLPDYSPVMRLILLTLSFYVGATAEGSLETALLTPATPNVARVYLYALSTLALLVTLAITQHKYDIHVKHREGNREA